jgi:hypothetical protein
LRARATIALLTIAALAGLTLLSGCGGDDPSSQDPQAVLDKALGGDESFDSGVLDIALDITSSGGQQGDLSAEIQGPFQSNGTGQLPSIDFDVTASVDSGGSSFDFDGGLTVTGDGAWVGFQGDEYQLDDATFQAVKSSYEDSAAQQADQGQQSSLQQFGIDPQSWVTDLTNEGTEDLDGTEVVHVSGAPDVPKLVADLGDLARQTGQGSPVGPASLKGLESTVKDASIDVYAASDDDSLRKLDIGLTLADPRGGSGEVRVDLSIAISDPGSEQSISGPSGAKPLADLLDRIPGAAGALGLAAGSGPAPQAPQASGSAAKYYDCVAKAKSAQAVDDCASLLGG